MAESSTAPCVNCGHSISKVAKKCPKCDEERLDCLLCGRLIKVQDLYRNQIRNYYTFHKDCLSRHFHIPRSVRCPDCNLLLAETDLQTHLLDLTANYFSSSCPNCGSPQPLKALGHDCFACNLPIFLAFQKEAHHPDYNYCDDHGYGGPEHFHEFCAACMPRLWQPMSSTLEQPASSGYSSIIAVVLICLLVVALIIGIVSPTTLKEWWQSFGY
jgi:hypothetical protein